MAKGKPAAAKRPKSGKWLGSGKRPPAHPNYLSRQAKRKKAKRKRRVEGPRGQIEADAFAAAKGNVAEAKRILAAADVGTKGCALTTNESVREAAEKKLADVLAEAGVDPVRTVLEVRRIAYADPRELFDEDGMPRKVRELSDDAAATVAGAKVRIRRFSKRDGTEEEEEIREIKAWDKPGALRDLLRMQGMLAERHEHTGRGGGPIETDTPRETRAEIMASLLSLVQPKKDPR